MRFSFRGDKELIKKLRQYKPIVASALMAGGVDLKGKVAIYPPRRYLRREDVYGETFVSDAQRRWFFAVGIYQTPYTRTSKLGQAWTVVSERDGLRIVVGNNTPYGPFVQDRDRQSKLHQEIGWIPYQDVAEKHVPDILEKIRSALSVL